MKSDAFNIAALVVQLLSRFVSLQPHGLQHARLPCPSPSPGVCSNLCPLDQWCHPAISSSVAPSPALLLTSYGYDFTTKVHHFTYSVFFPKIHNPSLTVRKNIKQIQVVGHLEGSLAHMQVLKLKKEKRLCGESWGTKRRSGEAAPLSSAQRMRRNLGLSREVCCSDLGRGLHTSSSQKEAELDLNPAICPHRNTSPSAITCGLYSTIFRNKAREVIIVRLGHNYIAFNAIQGVIMTVALLRIWWMHEASLQNWMRDNRTMISFLTFSNIPTLFRDQTKPQPSCKTGSVPVLKLTVLQYSLW